MFTRATARRDKNDQKSLTSRFGLKKKTELPKLDDEKSASTSAAVELKPKKSGSSSTSLASVFRTDRLTRMMSRSSSKTPEADETSQLRDELAQVKNELDQVKRELTITKGQLVDSEQKRIAAVNTLKIVANQQKPVQHMDQDEPMDGDDKENHPQLLDTIPYIDEGRRRDSIIVDSHFGKPELMCKQLQIRLDQAEAAAALKEREHQSFYRDLLMSIRFAERSRQEAVDAFAKFEKFLDDTQMGPLVVEHRLIVKKMVLLAWCQKVLEPTSLRVSNIMPDLTKLKTIAALVKQLFPKLLLTEHVSSLEVESALSNLKINVDFSFLDLATNSLGKPLPVTSVETYVVDLLLSLYKKSTLDSKH